jgi:hypothetical protein
LLWCPKYFKLKFCDMQLLKCIYLKISTLVSPKLLFNSVMEINVFLVTKSFTVSMPLVFYVDQFIGAFWKAIQGWFHRVEFYGSDVGSNRIWFIFFHIVKVFLTMKLLLFLALSFENRHVKRFRGWACTSSIYTIVTL